METLEIKGIKDEPIQSPDEDYLGIKDHALILAEFIKECDTPMTIGIQGDWGSGKTSVMKIIKNLLEKEKSIGTVWFNTWQYSQFNLDDALALALISNLVEEIQNQIVETSPEIIQSSEKIKSTLKSVFKTTLKIGVSYVSKGTVKLEDKEETLDPAKNITILKQELRNFVLQIRNNSRIKRIVIFIDDLDRLRPKKAIELLEVLKIFLDIEGCIFVLACDYKVILQGLKEKFGTTGEKEGKSFFDKIIQVPYNMPIHKYKIEDYIEFLLNRVGIPYKNSLIRYKLLLEKSVSLNPRSYKRLFNSFLLITKVIETQKREESIDYPFADMEDKITEEEKFLILFAVLCLQNKFEQAFYQIIKLLSQDKINQEWFDAFLHDDENKQKIREDFFKAAKITDEDEKQRFIDFIKEFFYAIQLKSDEKDKDNTKLSEDEISILRNVMFASQIVSVHSEDEFYSVEQKLQIIEDPEARKRLEEFLEELKDIEDIYIEATKTDIAIKTLGKLIAYIGPRKKFFTVYTKVPKAQRMQRFSVKNDTDLLKVKELIIQNYNKIRRMKNKGK